MRGGLGIGWSTFITICSRAALQLCPLWYTVIHLWHLLLVVRPKKIIYLFIWYYQNKYINPVCCIPNIQLSLWENHKSFHNVCNMLKVLPLSYSLHIFTLFFQNMCCVNHVTWWKLIHGRDKWIFLARGTI
jgi:hypothetical protein